MEMIVDKRTILRILIYPKKLKTQKGGIKRVSFNASYYSTKMEIRGPKLEVLGFYLFKITYKSCVCVYF